MDKQLISALAPKNLDELLGQEHILGRDKPLSRLIESGSIPSVVITGPSGVGKTSFARIIADKFSLPFAGLNAATDFTTDKIRKTLRIAEDIYDKEGRRSIVFIDEIHRATRPKLELFLEEMDKNLIVIGVSTENPFYSLAPAFRSRSMLIKFVKLNKNAMFKLIDKAEKFLNSTILPDAKDLLIKISGGDARRLLNRINAASEIALTSKITVDDIVTEETADYDRKEGHYDTISAFIKSVRGTDPDSALLWLAKMLRGGEDPLFIARRLMILSVEDIAMANALASPVAESCYGIVKAVGMPEAEIALAYATIFLATSPKSNSSYKALGKAKAFIEAEGAVEVPGSLRQNPPKEAGNYRYPHNYPRHYVKNRYSPVDINFYEASEEGYEARIKRFLKELKK